MRVSVERLTAPQLCGRCPPPDDSPGRCGPPPKRGLGLGAEISPSRMAVLRACLRARRTASAFSRALRKRPAVVALLKTIFAQDTAEAAHAQWRQVADTLRERFPKLAELMDASR